MRVEIWSDVVCPWCYIGKRRFEAALDRFAHRDEVEVTWRSFELDPGAPAERSGDMAGHLARKYGLSPDQAEATLARLTAVAAAEGLDYHLDRCRSGNTLDAHRLIHLGAECGVQDAVKERFLAGYFTEGEPIGDRPTLARLAVEAGLDPRDVDAVLAGDAFAAAVRADEEMGRELDITGVPCFVVDGRFAIPGAQDADTILRILERTWEAARSALPAIAGDNG